MQIIHDGPHFMFDPSQPQTGGQMEPRFVNVITVESGGARVVSTRQKQHVFVLADLLVRGYEFMPVVAMSEARLEAIRWARDVLSEMSFSGRRAGEPSGPLAELDALLAEVEQRY